VIPEAGSPETQVRETEIKLRLTDAIHTRSQLTTLGFEVLHPRIYERNLIFDTPEATLRNSSRLLRLRDAGGKITLTFKGPPETGKHKSREEREVHPDNFDAMQIILERLGYRVSYTYNKHRTEFHRPGSRGIATIDETPVGDFMELEGEPHWIDATAASLGFSESDYILASYAALYARGATAKSEPTPASPASAPEL
jgi:adenylate cyclase class 2